ncbi:hypothetical protein H257_05596 [Aphanomyces astaci]|uniref:Uncharacterized protein n=1 Tax=Aphanomyces astaci TaxID=112090 RepID=W4GQU6_APHAT|nr:hypothetical protein H257_05596 [Aphanomyces astaci]ETV82085.1 hypothetical protein H257_05596 [Aphanomyces astaci]|eukprot:XP_009828822.1 hypothetical protein H257_05596 [Aphanomyces astaci]
MFRQPSVVDLVSSSSSDEDDDFPVHLQHRTVDRGENDINEPDSPDDHHFHQLDEPMEIEEDEPFQPVVEHREDVNTTSVVNVASALESVLKDLESEEDADDEAAPPPSSHHPQTTPPYAIDLSQDDDDVVNDGHSTDDAASAFFTSMSAVLMKSKYEEGSSTDAFANREEGELSDDPSQLEQDASWRQKQLEATYLREAQVARRQAALRAKTLSSPSIYPPMSKRQQKKLKRKLHESMSYTAPTPSPLTTNTTSPYAQYASPQDRLARRHMPPPPLPPPETSILRVHRHNVVMDDSPLPSPFPSTSHLQHASPGQFMGSMHPPSGPCDPAVGVSPPPSSSPDHRAALNASRVIASTPPPSSMTTPQHEASAAVTPPVDITPTNSNGHLDDLSLLETLRNAVKRSVKKAKGSPPPEQNAAPVVGRQLGRTDESPPADMPVADVPSTAFPCGSSKMALGPPHVMKWPRPSHASSPPRSSGLKPLTACSQTVVIQLSTADCNNMRRRMQQVESMEKEANPIATLKLKIAARETELLLRKQQQQHVVKSMGPPTLLEPATPPSPPPLPSSAMLTSSPTRDGDIEIGPRTTAAAAVVSPTMLDPVAVAESHIGRLEKRIGELKHLISQKELMLVVGTSRQGGI